MNTALNEPEVLCYYTTFKFRWLIIILEKIFMTTHFHQVYSPGPKVHLV